MSRAYCYRCHRVAASCICQQAQSIENSVSVYVLQHPDETRHSKGTAIIANLSLQNYCCWQGEDFSLHEALNSLIEQESGSCYVVFPSADAILLDDLNHTQKRQIKNLIVIDATWRKAKKIWALSRNLHTLPAITLSDDYVSRYRIRKVPADGYLSTVEAISYCLAEIENQSTKYQPMLELFDQIIDEKIDSMGKDVYRKNYKE